MHFSAPPRVTCPKAMVRIAAGREHMKKELQAPCFLAGANSIFVGARLLTIDTPAATPTTPSWPT